MSSLEIAEVTGKEHKNVMRDIQTLLSQGVDKLNFERISYKDSMNRVRDAYQLTYKGVLILASGYNPVLREKIINRWEELETGKAEPKYAQQSPSLSQSSLTRFRQPSSSQNSSTSTTHPSFRLQRQSPTLSDCLHRTT